MDKVRLALATVLVSFAPALWAGPIVADVWHEFGFTDVGVIATGCDPADPAGAFCFPSSGTPTDFLDAPPWTFATLLGVTLTVTDAFLSGDQFELFDFGISIGTTSLPVAGGILDCGDDPAVCLATAGISAGSFLLGAGAHSITLVPILSPGGGGAGYLRFAAAVPEPGTLLLVGLGLLVGWAALRRR